MALPSYTAVIELVATGSEVTGRVATPLLSNGMGAERRRAR